MFGHQKEISLSGGVVEAAAISMAYSMTMVQGLKIE
jgi:hypothetical protein